MWRCGRTITARAVGAVSAIPGVILQPIVVKPAATTTEPGKVLTRKLRRLISLTGFSPMARLLSTETLLDCVRVLVDRSVGEADEDRNGDNQQQGHHDTGATDMALGALDVMHL